MLLTNLVIIPAEENAKKDSICGSLRGSVRILFTPWVLNMQLTPTIILLFHSPVYHKVELKTSIEYMKDSDDWK